MRMKNNAFKQLYRPTYISDPENKIAYIDDFQMSISGYMRRIIQQAEAATCFR